MSVEHDRETERISETRKILFTVISQWPKLMETFYLRGDLTDHEKFRFKMLQELMGEISREWDANTKKLVNNHG
jgi:hypothetical protein